MRVIVKSEGHKYFIPVPLWLGSVGLKIAMKFVGKGALTPHQQKEILELFKVLKVALKGYKGLKLVEVKDADGDEVTIIV
ncbi:MAG: hypothetical protein RR324_08680 [Cellulosilyticaceae bacterium]|uniref:hypothetical protein n=1 Tax=Niameybacter sp. TaxID=2033640 RepID=UPI002FC6D1A5